MNTLTTHTPARVRRAIRRVAKRVERAGGDSDVYLEIAASKWKQGRRKCKDQGGRRVRCHLDRGEWR